MVPANTAIGLAAVLTLALHCASLDRQVVDDVWIGNHVYFYFVQCTVREQYPKEKLGIHRRAGPRLDCSGYSEWISSSQTRLRPLCGCTQMQIE